MIYRNVIASSCVLGFLLGLPAAAAEKGESPPAVTEWISAHAIRLETLEARCGFADLQPLKNVIGNARIVALGEATHGTREFFQLKHRLLEFLATEMGFTIFSIEACMPESYRVNDYVLKGEGDPARLLKGMYFWTWNTEEVLDMIHWMREFNRSGKGRVEFTGFDMQTPTVANAIVTQFVATHDASYACHVSTRAVVVRNIPDLCWGLETPMPYFVVTSIQLANGKKAEWMKYQREVAPAQQKSGLKTYVVQETIYGGDNNMVYTLRRFDRFADLDSNPLRQYMGDEAYNALVAKRPADAVVTFDRSLARHRTDLSIVPEASPKAGQ